MNSPDQVKMHVRNAGLLMLAWGVTQVVMLWPPIQIEKLLDHGTLTTLPGLTGIITLCAGVGVLWFTEFGKWWGLLLARLRIIGCLAEMLGWANVLPIKTHVLDPMPLVVQQLVFVPFVLAQGYIIWVLTRPAVAARFERKTTTPVGS